MLLPMTTPNLITTEHYHQQDKHLKAHNIVQIVSLRIQFTSDYTYFMGPTPHLAIMTLTNSS